ncbi:MAG: M20/M25/M40 family metallo-hydrolase [Myxococcota bacterium]
MLTLLAGGAHTHIAATGSIVGLPMQESIAIGSDSRRSSTRCPCLTALLALACAREPIRADDAMATARALASDGMEGRGPDSAGVDRAADFVAARMRAAGLRVSFQSVPVTTAVAAAPGSALRVGAQAIDLGDDFRPLGSSSSGTVHGRIGGDVVVIEASDNEALDALARGGRDSGAKAVIVVSSAVVAPAPRVAEDAGLVAGVVPKHVGAFLRPGAEVLVSVALRRERRAFRNVIGIARGSDALFVGETVVVGAHYDHLGRGAIGSLEPESEAASARPTGRAVHPGADDNASGVAAMLEIAQALGARPARRAVVFVAFAAEELGLLGSARFVAAPPRPREGIVAMLNLDMVGRMRGRALEVHGVASAREWREILSRANALEQLDLRTAPKGDGRSDDASFSARGVPALFFSTGLHADYHRPTDRADLLRPEGIAAAARGGAPPRRRAQADSAHPEACADADSRCPAQPTGADSRYPYGWAEAASSSSCTIRAVAPQMRLPATWYSGSR